MLLKTVHAISLLVGVIAASATPVEAQTVTYTDRATWQGAVDALTPVQTENFDSQSLGALVDNAPNAVGLLTVTPNDAPGSSIRDGADDRQIDGTPFLRTTVDGSPVKTMDVAFGGDVVSIGFDFNELPAGDDVQLTLGTGENFTLSSIVGGAHSGFVGFISPTAYNSITFHDPFLSLSVVGIDNFSLALVPQQVTVPGDFLTIQSAIDASTPGSIITVSPGTYLERNLDFGGKDLVLTSSGGADVTIIDAQNLGRGFIFENGETAAAVVEGFTITRGSASAGANGVSGASPTIGGAGEHGGGILIDGASPVIRACVIKNCRAGRGGNGGDGFTGSSGRRGGNGGSGGGIRISGGSPTILGCTIANCSTGDGASGGRGSFSQFGGPRGGGGGSGGSGGGIHRSGGNPMFLSCIIVDCSAGDGGHGGNGGMLTLASGGTEGGDGGDGGDGGGIRSGGGDTYRGCTIVGNSKGAGGDPGVGFGLTGNDGDPGNAGFWDAYILGGSTTMDHCIVWDNSGTGFTSINWSNIQGGWPNGSNNMNTDPLFIDEVGRDLHLDPNSPCIDAGNPAVTGHSPTDIDGDARIAGTVDMGADESPVVDNTPSYCNGDGGDQMGCTDCPCMNNSPAGTLGGCLNSAGTSAALIASGSTSVSLPSGDTTDLRFALSGAPGNAFCILNSGDAVAPGNMANPCFGMNSGAQAAAFDGLRCAIMNTRRHGGRSADGNGDVGVTNNPWGGEGGPPVGLAVAGGGFIAGQTRYFQVINRDDALASCMRGLNTSQAVEVTFTP